MKLKQLKEDAFSDELLLDIDFSEFDKVIGFQASKDEDEKEINDTDSGVVVDFEDIDDDPMYDDIEDIQEENTQEEETQNKEPEENTHMNEDTPEESEVETEDITNESTECVKKNDGKYKSLAEVYEIRKNFKTNKLVESILCDSVVDCVYDALISPLSSHGLTKANASVMLGLMLDRMLKAGDSEVA